MGSFVYTPAIQARIATVNQVFDVSHDISQAAINRNLGVSSFSLTLTNRGRKYDGVFSPMDRVTIYLRRVGPFLLVMSGYLDSVPVFSTKTASVRLTGSCTLKRLQHWAWDPHSEAGANLMTNVLAMDEATPSSTDGGVAQRIVRVMDEVMAWPKEKIHIGSVPTGWFDTLGRLGKDLIEESEKAEMVSLVGNPVLGGQNLAKGLSTLPGDGPGTGHLPTQIATVRTFGGSGGEVGYMSLTKEPIRLDDNRRGQWGGKFYIQGRWPYRTHSGSVEGVDVSKASAWWKNRAILLTNPRTGKAVVCRAAHWGPTRNDTDVRISEAAFKELGLSSGQAVHMAFADPGTPPGPLSISAAPNVSNTPTSPLATAPVLGGVAALAQSAAKVAETVKYTHPRRNICNTFAALEDFLRWCVSRGLKVHEHPSYGGVNPAWHASIAEGGLHMWPTNAGGGAADVYLPGGGQAMMRLLDEAAMEAARRRLGIYWRWDNHWDHLHVDISDTRGVGTLQYVSDAAFRAIPRPTPLNGSPGDPSSASYGDPGMGGMMDPATMGEALFQTFQFVSEWAANDSGRIGGKRALINDVPLYRTIDELFRVGQRDWCSAPNGDLIGWFPDYFGKFGTAAKMVVEPIEVLSDGFDVTWSDEQMKTHMFVTSSETAAGSLLSPASSLSATSITKMEMTAGVASVEHPQMMHALFGLGGRMYQDGAKAFLERFGARPEWEPMEVISGPRAEFFFAVRKFMKNWSQQFRATIGLTFMPELYPGMIVAFPHWGVQAYVERVTHTINMETGFTTQPTLTAWSAIKGYETGVPGLPIGGAL